MANYRDEQLRANRRLARQAIGAVAIVLALIGLFTLLGWVVSGVRGLVSDTGRKESYADRLYGLVMLDAPAFENIDNVDPGIFKQAAIWGTVYQIQKNGGSLDTYERDADTGSAMIPRLEIDTYIANLLGTDYEVPAGSFSTEQFSYQYDEASQSYLVPVTSGVAQFTPVVDSIEVRGGLTYVTVGYIPTSNNSAAGEVLTAATEPTKYMDYVFTRGENRQWYLSALQTSARQPEATPAPTEAPMADDTQTMVESQIESQLTEAVATPDPAAEAEPEAPAESDAASDDAAADSDSAAASDSEAQSDSEAESDSSSSSSS